MLTNSRTAILAVSSVMICLLVAFVESVTYYGFISKHLFVPSYLIYTIGILITLVLRGSLPRSAFLERIAKYKMILIASSLIVLDVVEALTFPNFVFASIHLNLLSYPIFVLLALSFYVVYLAKDRSQLKVISQTLMVVGLGLYLHLNVPKVITGIYQGVGQIVASPFATYDQKMQRSYGDFYLAIKMVRELTPEDAIIAIPPQEKPWLSEGNGALVQYFIYPRMLTHIEGIYTQLVPTHYLIAKGSWDVDDESKYGWPKEVIKANRVWELRGQEYLEYTRDYDPETDKWNWGLIEVSP